MSQMAPMRNILLPPDSTLGMGNWTSSPPDQLQPNFPIFYRLFATTLHVLIFVFGLFGNIISIYVVLRTKSLQAPPYRYLVSLAFADLLVLISAVPEAIVFHHFGRQWMADQLACSALVFVNFLGINAGSVSTMAFTVEIYVAICRPLTAKKFCTMKGTNKTIAGLWIFAFLYCLPWVFLTEVKSNAEVPDLKVCDFRLSNDAYFHYFLCDLALFYFVPLLVALVVYCKIIRLLHHTSLATDKKDEQSIGERSFITPPDPNPVVETNALLKVTETAAQRLLQQEVNTADRMRSRAQVVWMLIAVVVCFAVSWLPYRGWLVLNTFLEQPWLDVWFLLFAKTLIYLNSAMNPILYATMSSRFRHAVKAALACRTVDQLGSDPEISLSPTFNKNPAKDGQAAGM